MTIDNEDYKTTFVLQKAKRSDSGTYTITAKNDSGTDKADVEIVVLSEWIVIMCFSEVSIISINLTFWHLAAPSKPKGPLKVSEVTADGCELKWQAPEDNGGLPVDHYVVERMDTEMGRWVPVCTSKLPEAEVTGLHEGKEYLFRVVAVNAEGNSEPLETDFGIIAKNPYSKSVNF